MKKIFSIFAFLIVAVAAGNAMTLKEAYSQIESMPDLKGVESGGFIDVLDGWVDALPFETAECTYKAHEVGGGQTVYYGSKVEELYKSLPKDELILSGADFQNLIYVYARPDDKIYSEVLILVDQAYQGTTSAIIGRVNNQMVEALKMGKVKFTADHQIVVSAPLLIFN